MKPVLQALLIADRVYEDKATGKKVIAGTFNRVLIATIPIPISEGQEGDKIAKVPGGLQMGSPCVFFSVTECGPETEFELRYVDLDEYKILMNTKVKIKSSSPLSTTEAVLPMPMLPTPHVGVYALELLWADELLGSLRIVVEPLEIGEKQ